MARMTTTFFTLSHCRIGKFLVDVIPALRFVPSWMPGAGFKTLASQWQKAFDDMVEVPYNFTRKMMVCLSRPLFVPVFNYRPGGRFSSHILYLLGARE